MTLVPGDARPHLATIATRRNGEGGAMAQVNTVRGPVDGSLLGRTLMHEHIFVLSPEIEKTAEEWDETAQRARAVTKVARAEGARDRHPGRPDRGGARPLHPARGGHRRGGARDQCRRGDGRVHLQRCPDVLPLPGPGHHSRWSGTDGGHVRPRNPRGDRRDGRARRHPQVRLGSSRDHARRRTRAPGSGAGTQSHRCAHHHAHANASGAMGSRAATRLQGGGRRPWAGRHRPQRRHRQYRLPPEPDRQRLVPRLRSLRPARHHLGGARRRGGTPVRPGLRRSDRPLARCHVFRRLVSPLGDGRVDAIGAGPTLRTRYSRPCGPAASARPTSPPCWSTTLASILEGGTSY